ncbi:MAG: zinc ribbon domain-containing protein [Pirellulaceae bacterium]|nr:zinc ribbon domain-containing protein [Pirellulaceae bacterium]
MPLYEYNCLDCREQVELLIRGQEEPRCPECEGTRLEKLLSAPAAHMGGHELPVCQPMPAGGCGLPQCGMGGCLGED